MSYKKFATISEYIAHIKATYSTYSAHLNNETISYLIHLNIDNDKVSFEKSDHAFFSQYMLALLEYAIPALSYYLSICPSCCLSRNESASFAIFRSGRIVPPIPPTGPMKEKNRIVITSP